MTKCPKCGGFIDEGGFCPCGIDYNDDKTPSPLVLSLELAQRLIRFAGPPAPPKGSFAAVFLNGNPFWTLWILWKN